MRPTILLFDLDGTLVDTGGAGRRAMEAAFSHVTSRDGKMEFAFGGMTDRAIVRKALALAGRVESDEAIDEVIELYLEILSEEVAKADEYRVLPGVEGAIAGTLRQGDVALGLGTGNVRRGAEIKLGRASLFESFGFGGFGCDHEDRAKLLAIGAERGAETLGRRRAECRVVVIGDTPKDIAAARAIDAECVAVGTGGVSTEELRSLGASAVFDDLTDPRALDAMLTSRD